MMTEPKQDRPSHAVLSTAGLGGWRYRGDPEPNKDARHFCTILQGGMVFVGVRFWNYQGRGWLVNGEPTGEHVLAWMPMPAPARGRWSSGQLHFADDEYVPPNVICQTYGFQKNRRARRPVRTGLPQLLDSIRHTLRHALGPSEHFVKTVSPIAPVRGSNNARTAVPV